jgi:hypothetical protein
VHLKRHIAQHLVRAAAELHTLESNHDGDSTAHGTAFAKCYLEVPFMDQKKNQGQQSDRSQGQGHQRQDQERSHGQGHQTHDEERHDMPSSGTANREKGRGGQDERNLGGGISNRDMDMDRELEEQDELPDRQSER